jgi:hypothetical protein
MLEEEDMKILRKMRNLRGKSRKSFTTVINNKKLSEEEMDELFLTA